MLTERQSLGETGTVQYLVVQPFLNLLTVYIALPSTQNFVLS